MRVFNWMIILLEYVNAIFSLLYEWSEEVLIKWERIYCKKCKLKEECKIADDCLCRR